MPFAPCRLQHYLTTMVCPISIAGTVSLSPGANSIFALAGVSRATTGLRSYSAELGRWISRDPIGENGGESLSVFISNASIGGLDFLGAYFLEAANVGWDIEIGNWADMLNLATIGHDDLVKDAYYGRVSMGFMWPKNRQTAEESEFSPCCPTGIVYTCTISETRHFAARGGGANYPVVDPDNFTNSRDLAFVNALVSWIKQHELGHQDIARAFIESVGDVTLSGSWRSCFNNACMGAESQLNRAFRDLAAVKMIAYRALQDAYQTAEKITMQIFVNQLAAAFVAGDDVPPIPGGGSGLYEWK